MNFHHHFPRMTLSQANPLPVLSVRSRSLRLSSAFVLSAALVNLSFLGQRRSPWPSQKDLQRQLDKAAADYFIQWRRPSQRQRG